MHNDITADDFISQLVDDGLSSVPWLDSTFTKDFILLAEFSELEGPKPIFTIPNDVNRAFNLEQFSLRIMSADCVSILQTTDLSTFNIAGDIQVVLTEVSEGAVAYVHHFILYDIRARGYVRPYCLAYVTRNYTGLMKMFETLRQCFSLVSTLFHFGNALNFIGDLIARWEQLHHLNEVLDDTSSNIFVGEKILSDSQKASMTKQDIEENMAQILNLRKLFLEYLEREVHCEHRELFNERYKQVCMKNIESENNGSCKYRSADDDTTTSCFPECNQVNNTEDSDFLLSNTSSHEIPTDVIASILGKRFDKPLRNLEELCDITYEYGMDILKAIVLKHCSARVALPTEIQFRIPLSIELVVEKNLEGGNPPLDPGNCCVFATKRRVSLKPILDKCHGLQAGCHKPARSASIDKKPFVFDIGNSFLSSLPITSLEGPYIRNNSRQSTIGGSFVSISPSGSSIEQDSSSSSSRENTTISSGMSRQTSSTDSLADYDKISLTSSVVSSIIKENISVGNLDLLKCSKISMLALRCKFSFLQHAVYSVLIGRPLLVIGEERNRNRVKNLVLGLANFVQTSGTCKAVIPWLSGSFTLNQIGTTSIAGINKDAKGKTISNSIKPYVSILNYEEETLLAPRYVGKFLSDMFNGNTLFSTDISYRHFILQLFTEFASKAFIQFVVAYGQPEKERCPINNSDGSRVMQKREVKGDEAIMTAFIQRMRDRILQKFSGSYCGEVGTNKPRVTIKLNTMKCSLFSNSPKRKK